MPVTLFCICLSFLSTHRILDNLPVAMVKVRTEKDKPLKTYERGYPIGFKAKVEVHFMILNLYFLFLLAHLLLVQDAGDEKYFLHNHLRFTVLYHKDPSTNLARVVGFEVEPFRCVPLIH